MAEDERREGMEKVRKGVVELREEIVGVKQGIALMSQSLDANTKITDKMHDAIFDKGGLVSQVAINCAEIKNLKKFKWYDRGLAIVSGVVGGWLAAIGLGKG